MICCI
jgi:hypothetical protein